MCPDLRTRTCTLPVVGLPACARRGHRACRGPRPFLCTGIATSPDRVPLGNRHAWENCLRE